MTLGPRNIDFFPPDCLVLSGLHLFFSCFLKGLFCLWHDSELRFLSVMTLLHVFSGVWWSWRNDYFHISTIFPTSNVYCLFYFFCAGLWVVLLSEQLKKMMNMLYIFVWHVSKLVSVTEKKKLFHKSVSLWSTFGHFSCMLGIIFKYIFAMVN